MDNYQRKPKKLLWSWTNPVCEGLIAIIEESDSGFVSAKIGKQRTTQNGEPFLSTDMSVIDVMHMGHMWRRVESVMLKMASERSMSKPRAQQGGYDSGAQASSYQQARPAPAQQERRTHDHVEGHYTAKPYPNQAQPQQQQYANPKTPVSWQTTRAEELRDEPLPSFLNDPPGDDDIKF